MMFKKAKPVKKIFLMILLNWFLQTLVFEPLLALLFIVTVNGFSMDFSGWIKI